MMPNAAELIECMLKLDSGAVVFVDAHGVVGHSHRVQLDLVDERVSVLDPGQKLRLWADKQLEIDRYVTLESESVALMHGGKWIMLNNIFDFREYEDVDSFDFCFESPVVEFDSVDDMLRAW